MTLFNIFGVTLAMFLAVILAMAIGVIMGRRSISGSCGGLRNNMGEGGESSCSLCSNPDAACQELSSRMNRSHAPGPDCDPNCDGSKCSKEASSASSST
ncbi:MAG: (Na+)-NQR maturation NqrM [Planctomycetales bacterium]|nr:(Na+)-NQR maturation NqrM [Planctomycetales bacterium]